MTTIGEIPQDETTDLNKEFNAFRHAAELFGHDYERYLEIIEFLPDATFVVDTNGRVIAWNKAIEKMTGVVKSDIIGKGNYEYALPFYNCRRPMLVDLVCAEDKAAELLYNFTQRDGHTLCGEVYLSSVFGNSEVFLWGKASPLFDREGTLVGAIESVRDITERRIREQALEESEERYRTLTESVADGVALVQRGKFLFVNKAFLAIFGYPDAKEIIGQTVADLIRFDYRDYFEMSLEALEHGRISNNAFQGICLSKDQREFWIEARCSIIKWNGRKAILSTITDITEAKIKALAIEEESQRLRQENVRLRSSPMRYRQRLGSIIGESPVMQEVYELIHKAAVSDANVIIYGESGTGKDLVAKAIHEMSSRKEGEFVPVNCGAIPENLLESEFFGHRKGAFTGAHIDKHGYLDLADDGSLFLDEIGELGMNIQVKLLRALEDGGYTPLGSPHVKYSDIRIIAATNKDLIRHVNMGLMREDFFYRIHVIPILIPPLRDRRGDIPLLVEHFIGTYHNGAAQSIPKGVMDELCRYDWPGNVRELQNVLHRYVALKSLDFSSPLSLATGGEGNGGAIEYDSAATLCSAVEYFEKKFILKALEETKWHKERTAAALGISRKTLFRKMKAYALI